MREIKIDFDNPGLPQRLDVVENDAQSRFFKAVLYKDGKAYTAPSGATYSIMYRGFGPQNEGWYDTINDGAGKRAACSVSGNVVTCEIARQALRVPGHVSVVLCVTGSNGYMLHGWPIDCNCRNDSYTSGTSVESFFYITQVTNADWTSAIQTWEELKNMIDPTLSISGKAADAKATRDAIGELKEDLADYISFSPEWLTGRWIDINGLENNGNAQDIYTDYIHVYKGSYIVTNLRSNNTENAISFYSDKRYQSFISGVVGDRTKDEKWFKVEEDCYIRLCGLNAAIHPLSNVYTYIYTKTEKRLSDKIDSTLNKIKNKYRYLIPSFYGSDKYLILLGSNDLRTFDLIAKKGESFAVSKNVTDTIQNTLRDPSIIQIGEYYYFTYTIIALESGSNKIGFCRTKDFDKWEELDNLSMYGTNQSNEFQFCWAPNWFRDGKNVYVVASCYMDNNSAPQIVVMKYDYVNHILSNGHTISGLDKNCYDAHLYKENGMYYLIAYSNRVYKSSSLTTEFSFVNDSQEKTEGQFALKLDNGKWRIYRQNLSVLGNEHLVYSDINTLDELVPTSVKNVEYYDTALNYIRSINGGATSKEYFHITIFDFKNQNGNNNNFID